MSRAVVVTGGRDFRSVDAVFAALDAAHSDNPFSIIAFGDASGVDRSAWVWAEHKNVEFRRFAADWNAHGKAAGPIRNGTMLRQVQPDCVLAFPGGRGTADCVRQAKALGITVYDALTGEEW